MKYRFGPDTRLFFRKSLKKRGALLRPGAKLIWSIEAKTWDEPKRRNTSSSAYKPINNERSYTP